MCVGQPMQIIRTEGLSAVCGPVAGREGACVRVSLALTGPLAVGKHVLVHLGSAIRVLDVGEAREIADALEAVTAAQNGQPFEHLLQDLIDREPELPAHLRPQAGGPAHDGGAD